MADTARQVLERLLEIIGAHARRRAGDASKGSKRKGLAKLAAAEVRTFERFAPQVLAALDHGDADKALVKLLDTLAPWIRTQHLAYLEHLIDRAELEKRADTSAGGRKRAANANEITQARYAQYKALAKHLRKSKLKQWATADLQAKGFDPAEIGKSGKKTRLENRIDSIERAFRRLREQQEAGQN